jgi:hypothetical protein
VDVGVVRRVTRLAKRDVEALLDLIDTEPVGVLTRLLQKVLDRPEATWPQLVEALPIPPEDQARLLDLDPDALYDLAALLNEQRDL